MGDQPEDAPAVENPPPPVNPPIQPIQPVNSAPEQVRRSEQPELSRHVAQMASTF